jgi:hypothetical protein
VLFFLREWNHGRVTCVVQLGGKSGRKAFIAVFMVVLEDVLGDAGERGNIILFSDMFWKGGEVEV